MKKLLNLLAIGILTSTSISSINMFLNTNLNQNIPININKKVNVYKTIFTKMPGIVEKINDLTFSSNEKIIYAASNSILYESTDGQSFKEKHFFTDKKIRSLITMPNGEVYIGTYQKNGNLITIYTINQGQISIKYSLNSHKLLSMTCDKYSNIYVGTNQGVYTNSISTEKLEKINGTTGRITVLKTTNNGLIYAGNSKGKIFKSIGGYLFNLIDQLENGGITDIAVDNKETVFVTNKSNQVYYKMVATANFLPYKQSLETVNKSVITFGSGVLVGDDNGNVWKSYQSKNFNKLNDVKIPPIKKLVYNSDSFTIFVTTNDGIYKNK